MKSDAEPSPHPGQEVAAEPGSSVKTLEKPRQRLMEKLNLQDTAGLTCHAIAACVVESSAQLTLGWPTKPGAFLPRSGSSRSRQVSLIALPTCRGPGWLPQV